MCIEGLHLIFQQYSRSAQSEWVFCAVFLVPKPYICPGWSGSMRFAIQYLHWRRFNVSLKKWYHIDALKSSWPCRSEIVRSLSSLLTARPENPSLCSVPVSWVAVLQVKQDDYMIVCYVMITWQFSLLALKILRLAKEKDCLFPSLVETVVIRQSRSVIHWGYQIFKMS